MYGLDNLYLSRSEKRRIRKIRYIRGGIVACAVGALLAYFTWFMPDIVFRFDTHGFDITLPEGTVYALAYEEIAGLSLVQAPDLGDMVDGRNDGTFQYGKWRNGEWGDYTLCAFQGASEYMQISTDSQTLLYGHRFAQTTRSTYEALVETLRQLALAP